MDKTITLKLNLKKYGASKLEWSNLSEGRVQWPALLEHCNIFQV